MLDFLKPDGTRVIDKAVGKFTTIIDSLERGISLCIAKAMKNDKMIAQLSQQNEKVEEKAEQGKIFRDNLKKMITDSVAGEEVKEEATEEKKEDKDKKDDN